MKPLRLTGHLAAVDVPVCDRLGAGTIGLRQALTGFAGTGTGRPPRQQEPP